MGCKGKVYLVGAGPGDPDLMTIKAARLIGSVDVVVFDRLISQPILDLIPDGVARISVGKTAGRHSVPQEETNELLVKLGRAGRQVVRLKGGDPFVFGRGSEEALALSRHAIPFEVVPGVTAASAVSAYAGVPLTHRGMSRGVRFVTGHFMGNQPIDLDWRALADPEATLVVYMGLKNLGRICSHLLAEGMDPATPAVAIQNGTTNQQRRVFGDIATLPGRAKGSRLAAPVLIVIGKTVAMAGELEWFKPEQTGNAHALAASAFA